MLRTLGLPCLLLQNPGPWFWGWKNICYSIIVFNWVATVGLIVQKIVQETLGKSKFIQAPLVFGESAVFQVTARGSSLGLVWVCCLGPAGSGGSE